MSRYLACLKLGLALLVAAGLSSCGSPKPKSYGVFLKDDGKLTEVPRYPLSPLSGVGFTLVWANENESDWSASAKHAWYSPEAAWPLRDSLVVSLELLPPLATPGAHLVVYFPTVSLRAVQVVPATPDYLVSSFMKTGHTPGMALTGSLSSWTSAKVPLSSIGKLWDVEQQAPFYYHRSPVAEGTISDLTLVTTPERAAAIEVSAAPLPGLPNAYELTPTKPLSASYYAVFLLDPDNHQAQDARPLGFFCVGPRSELDSLTRARCVEELHGLTLQGFSVTTNVAEGVARISYGR